MTKNDKQLLTVIGILVGVALLLDEDCRDACRDFARRLLDTSTSLL